MPNCVTIYMGESLVMNQVLNGCMVVFIGRETWANLRLLDMVDLDAILYRLVVIISCNSQLSCQGLGLSIFGLLQLLWTCTP